MCYTWITETSTARLSQNHDQLVWIISQQPYLLSILMTYIGHISQLGTWLFVHRAMGCRKKKSFQLLWRCHKLLSEVLAKGHLPRLSYPDIYLTAKENPGKPELGNRQWGLCDQSVSNGVPYLQVRPVGSHSTSINEGVQDVLPVRQFERSRTSCYLRNETALICICLSGNMM